jgi:hypothetical protein
MDKYSLAKKRVEAKIGFFVHLIIFIVVNGILAAVDILASPEKLWFYYPLAGWGLGLLLHGIGVFYHPVSSGSGPGFKERLIEKELKALERSQEPGEDT